MSYFNLIPENIKSFAAFITKIEIIIDSFQPLLVKKNEKNSNHLDSLKSLRKNVNTLRTSASLDEKLLIKKCIKGDKSAQLRLYKKYIQAMYNVVIRMVPNKMDAEDILQDSFVKIFQHLKNFKGESTLGAWIKRIVINDTLSFIRKNKKISYTQITDAAHFVEETSFPSQNIKMNEIHEAIKRLPEGARVILTLHLLEGYQHKEIAQILSISESTSKTQYHRAKKLLKKKLSKKIEYYSIS